MRGKYLFAWFALAILHCFLCYSFFFRVDELATKVSNGLLSYVPQILKTDSAFHFLFFIAYPICLLLIIAIIKTNWNKYVSHTIGISLLWIVLIEYLQPFFSRTFSWLDMLMGILGLLTFSLLFKLTLSLKNNIF